MAGYFAESVIYYLCLPAEHKDFLGSVRQWKNLKLAFEDKLVWVKGLSYSQVESIEIKTIPFKEVFYASGSKLFPPGSLLPARNIPSVLWTDIERALSIELTSFNHNYFGIEERLDIKILPSEKETPPCGCIASIKILEAYMASAPSVRLKNLTWVLSDDHAIILGIPLLPLQGEVLWSRNHFLIPAGYDIELFSLVDEVNRMINPDNQFWIVWSKTGSYYKIPRTAFKPLSMSSFRQSV
jgi:hypothetical protein